MRKMLSARDWRKLKRRKKEFGANLKADLTKSPNLLWQCMGHPGSLHLEVGWPFCGWLRGFSNELVPPVVGFLEFYDIGLLDADLPNPEVNTFPKPTIILHLFVCFDRAHFFFILFLLFFFFFLRILNPLSAWSLPGSLREVYPIPTQSGQALPSHWDFWTAGGTDGAKNGHFSKSSWGVY